MPEIVPVSGFPLNEQQRAAVEHSEGAVLILAGAGSGKTRVITERIIRLIEQRGVAAERILAVTFTNKASREMLERVRSRLETRELPVISTFHSLCAKLLRQYGDALGFAPSFSIYDAKECERLLKDVCEELGLAERDFPVKRVAAYIDDCKNRGVAPGDTSPGDEWLWSAHRAYHGYQERLLSCNAMDFGDLLLHAVRLLESSPEVLARIAGRFDYVMVDEYQDTNCVQYRLVRLLTGGHGNLCVVGDEDQSIYGWRGADIRNILDFEKDFPGALMVRLEQNYRCSKTILAAANQVVAHNRLRKGKTLWTANGAGEPIFYRTLMDEREEASFVAQEIARLVAADVPQERVAVLYRTNAQSRVFEEYLNRQRLRYHIVGGVRFYDRQEVKDALAYLKLIANPADDLAFRRIVNVPARGIGDATLAELGDAARDAGASLTDALESGLLTGGFRKSAAQKLSQFAALVARYRARAAHDPPGELLRDMLEETGYQAHYQQNPARDAQERAANLRELVSAAAEFGALHDFLEHVALVTGLDEGEDRAGGVVLMTVHAAKGLEFDTVFVAGMEDGLFPLMRPDAAASDLEEERRLCYVAMTRAEQRLYLTNVRERLVYGKREAAGASRFIGEIDAGLLRQERSAVYRRGWSG